MAKWMWVIASPNSAGKSSFAGQFRRDFGHRRLQKLNADDRTLELRQQFADAAQNTLNLQAAIDIDKEVERSIKAGRSFVVETVLSSPKFRDDVLSAGEWIASSRALLAMTWCGAVAQTRNTPYPGSPNGALSDADIAMPSALRVSTGSSMPSSQISDVA